MIRLKNRRRASDTQFLDGIAVRLADCRREQDALFKRPQADYTVDNEDILARFSDHVERLLSKRLEHL